MIWGYGSDKFLVNGLGSIFISLLMLEQMHTLLAVPSQKDRENRYIARGGCCDRNYGIYAVLLDK